MKDSIPYLRRLVGELQARVKELEARPDPEPVVRVERVIEYVEREIPKMVPSAPQIVHIPVYIDNPEHIETIRKLQECLSTSQSDS